jgi:hypothetical protein
VSFVRRRIGLTFQLGRGSFGEEGYDTIKLTGRRVSCSIVKAGGASMGECQLVVYGMLKQDMDALSTLGQIPTAQRRNTLVVEVGDENADLSTVYIGSITNAYFNAQAAPETSFVVLAHAGLVEALRPIGPTSIIGPVDVAVSMAELARQCGLDFEDNGVKVTLPTVYFAGTARDQIKAMADAANINWIIDNGKLAIWPRPGRRATQPRTLVSPDSGMVGYPVFNVQGIEATTLFNPGLVYGAAVQIERSAITKANGEWYIYTLYYELESELPGGKWFTRFLAAPPGYVPLGR